ncbi:MAG: IS21 family transposase [Coriobacteriaceae bacterium]|jgi:transposase|nr:IS21 family transposase [Coriobacteriaceae bacterium]
MVNYKRILELRKEDVSQRGIAEALKCSRNTVASVLAAAAAASVGFVDVAALDNAEIGRTLFSGPDRPPSAYAQPDFEAIHKELARTGVTLLMLWGEYSAACRANRELPYQYSFFCDLYRRWAKATKATMRIPRTPAEVMEVDWAGDTMEYADPLSGEARPAHLFVAAMTYSAYSYVEAFCDMGLQSWIDAHINAFRFFGGAARLLVPDNLRTGVSRPDRYEPALNATYAALAEHYGTAIVPARVRHPKDKPAAEGSVGHIAYAIAGVLRDRRFVGLPELNDAIADELGLLNARPFQKREGSRSSVFDRDERALLVPLPLMPFEPAELRKAKVGPNYHVQVDGCFYSVPSRHIGQTLDIRLTVRLVEVFDGDSRVCSHPRVHGRKGAYSTVEEHMPPSHREYLRDWTPDRFLRWAESVGAQTARAAEAILASRKIKEQGYRSLLGLLSLAKKDGGKARLEQACRHALEMTQSPSYTMIKRIWADIKAEAAGRPDKSLGSKGYVRGPGYYAGGKAAEDGR